MSEIDTAINEENAQATNTNTNTLKRTPLPKFQLFIVALIQFSEPITATVIYPFVNQFVQDTGVTGGDERKTGYYAGIIESAFFFAEALTVFSWGRLSDRYGRRPILLLGPLGLAAAMFSFGLSTTFWPLVVSRCFQGVFNGNIGVSKSVMGEITDDTNIGDAFAMIPIMWTSGSTVGPIMGGVLTSPAKRWPTIFGNVKLFVKHPYFLPCAAAGSIAVLTFLIASVGLKESLPAAVARRRTSLVKPSHSSSSSTSSLLQHQRDNGDYGTSTNVMDPEDGTKPAVEVHTNENPPIVPLRDLFTRRVVLTLMSHLFLVFIDMSYMVLMPLMYSTSISLGGLGLTPYQIGSIMGTWGFINAIVQLNSLGRLIRRFGPRKTFITANAATVVYIGLYPFSSYFARKAGRVDWKVVCVMVFQLSMHMTKSIAYGSMHILVIRSVPNKSSLGATIGLAQMLGCLARSFAPTVASSLFSISLEHQLAGGNMVYFVLQVIAAVGICASLQLPDDTLANRE